METRTNPRIISELMRERGLRFKKKYGQNFLIDANIARNIVESMNIKASDRILEIGGGMGSLTEILTKKSEYVQVVEIDALLADYLRKDFPKIEVIEEDILEKDPLSFPKQVKIVGNLPYYITSAIIMHFLESELKFENLTIMMQKEVAKRLSAKPKTKDYGVLTVIANLLSEVHYLFDVSRHCFMPAPRVDSAVVQLIPRYEKVPKELIALIKQSFSMRRKTLQNNLSKHYERELLSQAFKETEIEPSRRAETLSTFEFENLYRYLKRDDF